MSGRVAEETILGSCPGGDGNDQHEIALMLDSIVPVDADITRVRDRLLRWARTLVARHRATIERVAALLMKHKTLQPEEIEAAMKHSGPA